MKYFGRSKHAAICDELERIEAPTCAPCQHCGEAIGRNDDGFAIDQYQGGGVFILAPYHRACFLRGIIGSVAHQLKRCSCYGGADDDDADLTVREAAQAAVDLWERK